MASQVAGVPGSRSGEGQHMEASSHFAQSNSNYYPSNAVQQTFAEQHFVNAQRQLCDSNGRLWGYYEVSGEFTPQCVDGQTGQVIVCARHAGKQMVLQGSIMVGGMTGMETNTHMINYQSMSPNQQRYISGVSETSNVIGREFGQERIISVSQRVDESKMHIVSERYIDHEVRIPKKIIREEIIEKLVVIPERIIQEEIIEDIAIVKERIVEVSRPMIMEKIVEIPEIEYVERVVEYPEVITQERIRHVDKIVKEDRYIDVDKVIMRERKVEVADVQYREFPRDKIVEVPEWTTEVVYTDVPVPQYVDKPIENIVQVEVAVDIGRVIPVPVEANVVYEFKIPTIKPRYHKITYPVYLPRFIEIPVAMELLQNNSGLMQQTETYLQQIGMLTKSAASLCEIENLAATIMKADIQSYVSSQDLQNVVLQAWQQGTLTSTGMGMGMGMGMTQTTTSHTTHMPMTMPMQGQSMSKYHSMVIPPPA